MLKWEKRLLTGNQITGMKYMDKQYRVKKLDKPVDWMVEVPGSKSMTNRAREFDTLKCKKVPQSLEIGLFFCQIFIFII